MNDIFYKIFHGTVQLLSRLPFRVLYFLSDVAFIVVYHIARYRRKIVRKNLRNSFPEKSLFDILLIERRFYRFFCDYIVETLKLLTISPAQMRRHMTMSGIDALEKSLEHHTLCFIYLGHYCNWEYVATLPLWVPEGVHCAQIYSPLRDRFSDRLFYEIRTRFGGENIAKKDTFRRLVTLQQEQKKTIVGFISDQAPRRINIHDWVDFLCQDTPVFTGAERLSKKLDAAVFYCDMQRIKRGYYHCTFRLMTENPKEHPNYELTDTYMKMLQDTIRKNPPYWLWSHNRWKRKRLPEDQKREE